MRRGSGHPAALRQPLGALDPAEAWATSVPPGADAFWLDAADGSGRSLLGLGAGVVRDLDALRGTDALGHVGWIRYEGEAEFLRVERMLEFEGGRATHVSLDGDVSWVGAVGAASSGEARPVAASVPSAVRWRDTDERYLAAIAACHDAIRDGDAYVLCLTTSARVDGPVDIEAAYAALRATSPAHHAGLVRIGATTLASASPELFLRVRDGVVESRPIKGTRPRHPRPLDDAALAAELAASEKERAENTMIVDLVRNDLARVCVPGSVEVADLHVVETYPHVHQLVSRVRGRLVAGRDAVDAVRSAFPAGSMTGAPKISAMSILDRLEGAPRGLYSGVFGWLGADGDAELAMVIRSIVVQDGVATVGSGGGITADSIAADELAEVRLKAAAPLAALGVR